MGKKAEWRVEKSLRAWHRLLSAQVLRLAEQRGVRFHRLIEGCEIVLTSKYASVGGIPTASFGSLYYLVIFLLALLSITRKEKKYLLSASKLTLVGFIASLCFVFLQLFVIKAICLYCMLSAVTSSTLFILGMTVIRRYKKGEDSSAGTSSVFLESAIAYSDKKD